MERPEAATFPEERYRLRYHSLDPDLPCGRGCLYNCCAPVLTSFHIEAGPQLTARLKLLAAEHRRQVERVAPFLKYEGLSLPELPPVPGIDTARAPRGSIQVSLIWRCPYLVADLCAIYHQRRPIICTDFVHCPERFVAILGEEEFLEIARSYWQLRQRVLVCAAPEPEAALVRAGRSEG